MRKLEAMLVIGALCAHSLAARAQPGAIDSQQPVQQPGAPLEAGPPPPGPVAQPSPGSTHATFTSTTPQIQWDVTLDDRLGCTTPCTLWVHPREYVALHSRDVTEARLEIGVLGGGDLRVDAKPLARGEYATGVTFTALAGAGVATGITLAAVGCFTDNSALCEAGAITGIPSALVLAASIELIRHALPRAYVRSARPYVAGNQVGFAGSF